MPRERTGRRIRKQSLELDRILRQVVKEKTKEAPVYGVIKRILVDKKDYSLSDYERFIKWLNDYPKRKGIEVGLLIDILDDLGIDFCECIKEAKRKRSYPND